MSRGIVTIGSGPDEYVMLAAALLKSIRINAPGEAVAIVTDRLDHPVVSRFDDVIPLDPGRGPTFLQKLHLDLYSPYDETMYVDADCLVYGSLDDLWDRFVAVPSVGVLARLTPTPVWCTDTGVLPAEYQLDDYLEFNGGLYFIRRGETTSQLFAEARDLYHRSEELGLMTFGAEGADEPALGLALSRAGVAPIDDGGHGMRTPSALSGRPRLDVAGRRAEFVKWGTPVTPTIVHFAGGRWRLPIYHRELLTVQLVNRGVPRPVARAVAALRHAPTVTRRISDYTPPR